MNNGEEDKYYIKDHHEAIIPREEWEEAQDILNTRNASILKGRKIGKASVMSGKMRCGFCGKGYTKRMNNNVSDRIYWSCMTSVKGSKSFCPNSKSIPEHILKQTFMESYYLLTNNEGLALDKFVENIKESLKDSTPELMKAKYVNQRDQTKTKLSKLVDLYVDGEINRDVYERKQNGLQDRLSEINSKIAEIEKISCSETKFENHIMKLKNELKSRESVNKLEDFDNDVFNTLVDYVIIGGLDETGTPNEYLVRFICKSGFDAKSRKDISEEVIIKNGLNCKDEGIYIPVIDFLSTQKFYVFDTINGRRQKKIIDKIRVRVELEK